MGTAATLIVGSSGAIGSGLRRFHADRGEAVITVSRSGADFNLDLRSDDDVQRVSSRLAEEGRLFERIYVASGVIGEINSIADLSVDSFRDCIEANLIVPIKIVKFFSGLVIGNGSIVFLSGGGASGPMPYFSPYAASKAGLVRLIETIALENALRRIRLYAVGPGRFKSQMLRKIDETAGSFLPEKEISEVKSVLADSCHDEYEKIRKIVILCDALDSLDIGKVTGKFFSATWDSAAEVIANIDSNPDAYTLRRIDSKYVHPR